jgi:hypothetical protein
MILLEIDRRAEGFAAEDGLVAFFLDVWVSSYDAERPKEGIGEVRF